MEEDRVVVGTVKKSTDSGPDMILGYNVQLIMGKGYPDYPGFNNFESIVGCKNCIGPSCGCYPLNTELSVCRGCLVTDRAIEHGNCAPFIKAHRAQMEALAAQRATHPVDIIAPEA